MIFVGFSTLCCTGPNTSRLGLTGQAWPFRFTKKKRRQQLLAASRTRIYAPATEPPAPGSVVPPRPNRPAPAPRGRAPNTPEPVGAASSAPKGSRHRERTPPQVVPQVAEVDRSNIIICFDWHNTLDSALNPLKLYQSIVDKFLELDQAAHGRVEYHVVSYSGVETGRKTKDTAENLIGYI